MVNIIQCLKCNRYIIHFAKGYCNSCYLYFKRREKRDNSPLIKCQCSDECQEMIHSINTNGTKRKYQDGHIAVKRHRYDDIHKYDYFFKPNYIFSNGWGYVFKHRYIMYIYLSILNNKPTYIQGFDVHHKNENTRDNRIENLQLLTRSEHITNHNTKDMSNRFCNICNSKYSRDQWYDDIEGFICRACYASIKYYQKKFNI